MALRMRWLWVVLVAALVVWAVPAGAHTQVDPLSETIAIDAPPTQAWQADDAPAGLPWAAGLVVLAVIAAGARRPRRALALAVVLILALFAYENGVHSVHHMNDHAASASCALASAGTHVSGTTVDAGTPEAIVLRTPERVVLAQQSSATLCSLAVHQGRAPPLAA